MKNRPEIDGLRAVAVLPVIFFHAGFNVFAGGFVGVDVFFVISGFLITGIIAGWLERGEFSIVQFYERRARRILPALFVIVAICIPFAQLWMLPAQLKEFNASIVGVIFFASNFVFWYQQDYFAQAADLKPLLHTWSLAVEEQFYVIFPLLLFFLWRLGRKRVLVILIGLAMVSLALSEYTWRYYPSANFYLPHTRAWELFAGSICALLYREKSGLQAEFGACAGLALILFSIFFFDSSTPFPSIYALVPVIGTSLIMLYGSGTLSGRILSAAPLRWVGLISYSAYLWHQPLLAFARIRSTSEPSQMLMLALSILSLIMAYPTWKYIENPARKHGPRSIPRKVIFAGSAIIGASFAVTGAYGTYRSMPPDLSRESTAGKCNFGRQDCFQATDAKANIAIWGDSYADAFALSLGRKLQAENVHLTLFIRHSCPSLIGVLRNEDDRLGKDEKKRCKRHNLNALKAITEQHFDAVVITSAYQWYATGRNTHKEPILITDGGTIPKDPQKTVAESLVATIKAINDAGITPIVVTPHPQVSGFDKKRMALHFGDTDQIFADPVPARKLRNAIVSGLSAARAKFLEVNGLDFYCNNEDCPIVGQEGEILLYDGSHISTSLSPKVADMVVSKIHELMPSS